MTVCVHIVVKYTSLRNQKAIGKVKRCYYRLETSFSYFNRTESPVVAKACVVEGRLLKSLAGALKHHLPSDVPFS